MQLGLALSGGGLRATLYHLGVVRFLKDAGLLESVSHITSVSGGSVLAAHLVLNWERYTGSSEEFEGAAQEVFDFVRLDVRNRIIRRYPFALSCGFLQRFLGKRSGRSFTRTGLLANHYRDFLYGDTCLHQLPVKPELHILSTNLSEGRLSSFTRSGLLLEERTKTGGTRMRNQRAGLATVPMAVAASSAFPGFFPPMELAADDIGVSEGEFQTQFFTDGGVYDNLGIRMFRYLERQQKGELSQQDFTDPKLAVQIWKRATESPHANPLQRIAQIHGNLNLQDASAISKPSAVADTGQLVKILQRIIDDADLATDSQLTQLLAARGGSQEWQESLLGNGIPTDVAEHAARNRQWISMAFACESETPILEERGRGFDAVIASDAGKTFQVTRPDRAGSFLRTALRSSDILMDRVWQLEKEHFAHATDYVFVPITRLIQPADDPTALHPEVQAQVGKIRTDMDRFYDREVSGLLRQGYCVARQAISSRLPVPESTSNTAPWDPKAPPVEVESQDAVAIRSWRGASAALETEQARKLTKSSRRDYLGVLLSPKDWVTYLYVPVLVLVFGFLPYSIYQTWRHGYVAATLTSAVAETSHDYRTLLDLMEYGTVEPWKGMDFVEADHLDPLFAEKGLDIISDSRITDVRQFAEALESGSGASQPLVYVYRHVSVRKMDHAEGLTGLKLQSLLNMPEITVRCRNPDLHPRLVRCRTAMSTDAKPDYTWQLQLDFRSVPVGHTTNVIVEALIPAPARLVDRQGRPWWEFEVDADPEVATSWLLLPKGWSQSDPRLIRYENASPKSLELVEPTQQVSILGNSILNWVVVHPKAGYTYTYRWNGDILHPDSNSVRQARSGTAWQR